MKKHVLLDTDPGIDDSLAILLALASPELLLEGVTVAHGNCSAVDLSGGPSMGKTYADFYKMLNRPPNTKVALGVRPRAFLDLFLDRMERLCLSR